MLSKIMQALMPHKPAAQQVKPHALRDKNEQLAPNRWQIVTDSTVKAHYKRYPFSFADQLSVMEYRADSQSFELEDGFSQAAVLTCIPVPTEGRDKENIDEIRESIVLAFQKTFASVQQSPWILQFYSYKEEGLHRYVDTIESFIKPGIRETALTQDYLAMMRRHLKGVNRDGGIFTDRQVTNASFQGQIRQCKLIIYRRCTQKERNAGQFEPASELNDVIETFSALLDSTGIQLLRDNGKQFQEWLTDWFNPKPALTNGDSDELKDLMGYPTTPEETPYCYNLSENVVHSQPISDPENKCWWFDGVPHQYIRCNGLMRRPKSGQLTGEIKSGSGKSARASSLMDYFPSGSMFHQTIVIQSEQDIDRHIESLGGVGKSETKEAQDAELAIGALHEARQYGMCVYKSSMGVFIRANPNLDPSDYANDLKQTRSKVFNLLLRADLSPQEIDSDELQIESYLTHLPMNFVPQHDTYGVYLGLYYDRDLIDLCPLWGRERGTGNPGFISFNRGGELLTFDQFGADKVRSSAGVLIGPQGSGKSATMNALAQAVAAVHRPFLYILDKGGSFRIMGDYFERLGMKVKRLKLTPGVKNVHLNPYADSHLIFEDDEEEMEDAELPQLDDDEDDDEAKRDPMGEMLSATVIMVTGGNVEESKKITQTHRSIFESAITKAAEITKAKGRQTIISDVCDALELEIRNADVDQAVVNEMKNFLVALRAWTKGFKGKIFNSEGKTFDDEADVTIIDVSTFSKAEYEAELSVVYVALSTHLFNVGEKNQSSGRDLVYFQDETHLYSTKPLLAPFMAEAVKLMRKIGIKGLYATQNVSDFQHGSEKILKIIEWWYVLNPEKSEIDEVHKYRPLTTAQREMLLSCSKQPRCYTEGVVMGNRQVVGEMLLRFVPPSEILAYAMTDPEEKNMRRDMRIEKGIEKDIDSARLIAEELDIRRKIIEPSEACLLETIYEEQRRRKANAA